MNTRATNWKQRFFHHVVINSNADGALSYDGCIPFIHQFLRSSRRVVNNSGTRGTGQLTQPLAAAATSAMRPPCRTSIFSPPSAKMR